MEFNLKELAQFLVNAKRSSWASDGKKIIPKRLGFKELEYIEGYWKYRDSYAGYFMTPGQECVRFNDVPVWIMSYGGGMLPKYLDLAKSTFSFLKKALKLVEVSRPFRGPEYLKEGDWEYKDSSEGDISDFKGTEHIFYKGKEVFRMNYCGSLVIPK